MNSKQFHFLSILQIPKLQTAYFNLVSLFVYSKNRLILQNSENKLTELGLH